MKVCIVAEGCYPYVVGGVSSWIHSMINAFPNIEFVILALIVDRQYSGKFAYELPKNVTQVCEAYLDDVDWGKRKFFHNDRLNQTEYRALRSLVMGADVDWDTLFALFGRKDISIDDILMGEDFLKIVRETYDLQYPQTVFSDFLWTMRSIYRPLFLVLQTQVPEADIYHCVATGYAGVLGSKARFLYHCGLMISEHGIYTREREEELIKAKWVEGIYKNIWIEQFRKMSRLGYERADIVTCLFRRAKELQVDLGCPREKIRVTPNGIKVQNFQNLPGKPEEDKCYVDIGAVLRVTPIKDVKTMIRAFGFAKEKLPSLRLWIMGPAEEDPEYAQECYDLVETMEIVDVFFTGRVNVREYLGKMDFTILTSISEGQPLTILESFAAKKPVVATDVGNCRELIYGPDDFFGDAGILTHIMNVQEISKAMLDLAKNARMREEMGENGYKRAVNQYTIEQMQETYSNLYQEVGAKYGKRWTTEPFML